MPMPAILQAGYLRVGAPISHVMVASQCVPKPAVLLLLSCVWLSQLVGTSCMVPRQSPPPTRYSVDQLDHAEKMVGEEGSWQSSWKAGGDHLIQEPDITFFIVVFESFLRTRRDGSGVKQYLYCSCTRCLIASIHVG